MVDSYLWHPLLIVEMVSSPALFIMKKVLIGLIYTMYDYQAQKHMRLRYLNYDTAKGRRHLRITERR
jgi:hypothetical protein